MKYTFDAAVSIIERHIRCHSASFSVPTEFGTIVVKELTEDYDKMDPVEVDIWSKADSDLIREWSKLQQDVDYYVGIGNCLNEFPLHIHAIEAMCKVMFMHSIGYVPDEDIVDAAVTSYLMHQNRIAYGSRKLVKEFLKINADLIHRKNETLVMVTTKMIELRIAMAERTLESSKKIIEDRIISPVFLVNFRKPYYLDFLGLILESINRDNLTYAKEHFNPEKFKKIVTG